MRLNIFSSTLKMGKVEVNSDIKPYPQPINTVISANMYRTHLPFVYTWEKDGVYYRITIPNGIETDGATVPRGLYWFMERDMLIRGPALIHDILLHNAGDLGGNYQRLVDGVWKKEDVVWTREKTNLLFFRMCREAGFSKFRRRAAYTVATLFGHGNYPK